MPVDDESGSRAHVVMLGAVIRQGPVPVALRQPGDVVLRHPGGRNP
ncbi:MAG: hypothetical protein ACRDSZ_03755 [Pseudonocardiaceae bacterium]